MALDFLSRAAAQAGRGSRPCLSYRRVFSPWSAARTASAVTPAAPAATTAWDLFHKLLPAKLLNDLDPKAPQTVYTPWLVTWLLVFQRLHGNASLNDAVAELLLRFPEQVLPDCQRARQRRLSANSGAYSAARTGRSSPRQVIARRRTFPTRKRTQDSGP